MTYAALRKDGTLFIEVESGTDPKAWLDETFANDFENQIERYFKTELGNVVVGGAEFNDCKVYTPIEGIDDFHYVKLNESGVPTPITQENDGEMNLTNHFSRDEIGNRLSEVVDSEKFYNHLSTSLSNEYLQPRFAFEGEKERQLFSTADVLTNPRILIVGSGGMGKTSFVRRLSYDLNKKLLSEDVSKRTTCTYLKLRDFDPKVERLTSAIDNSNISLGLDFSNRQIANGRQLYIFDGLDELNADRQQQFLRWYSHFQSLQPSIRVIITSREIPALSASVFSNFKKAKLSPFSDNQIYEYSLRYFGSIGKTDAFFDKISGNKYLMEVLSTPLSLSLSLALYTVRNLSPYNLGTFARELTLHLTEVWDERRGVPRYQILNARAARSILGKLAHRLQVCGKFTFDSDEISDLMPFEYEKHTSVDVLEELKTSTGLLTRDAGQWSFSHRYFQDFFCANHVIEQIGSVDDRFDEFHADMQWAAVWRYVGELCSDPEHYIELANSEDGSGLYALDKLLAVLLSDARIGSGNLQWLLSVAAAKFKSLSRELVLNRLDNGDVRVSFERGAVVDSHTLASLFLNFYHLSKLSSTDSFNTLIDEHRQTNFGKLVSEISALTHRPDIVSGEQGIVLQLSKGSVHTDHLVSRVATKVGIDESIAKSAIGIILNLLNDAAPADKFDALTSALPGAEALMSRASAMSADLESSDVGKLMDSGTLIAGALGGGGIHMMVAFGQLQGQGLSMDQIRQVGEEVVDFARKQTGDDLVQDIASTVPGLNAIL